MEALLPRPLVQADPAGQLRVLQLQAEEEGESGPPLSSGGDGAELRGGQPTPTHPPAGLDHLQVMAQVHDEDFLLALGDEAGAHVGCGVVQIQDQVEGLGRAFGPQELVQFPGSCYLVWVIRGGLGTTGAGMRRAAPWRLHVLCAGGAGTLVEAQPPFTCPSAPGPFPSGTCWSQLLSALTFWDLAETPPSPGGLPWWL